MEKVKTQDIEKDIESVVLKSIDNDYEFNLTKAILENNSIPFVTKDHGSEGYFRPSFF